MAYGCFFCKILTCAKDIDLLNKIQGTSILSSCFPAVLLEIIIRTSFGTVMALISLEADVLIPPYVLAPDALRAHNRKKTPADLGTHLGAFLGNDSHCGSSHVSSSDTADLNVPFVTHLDSLVFVGWL